MFEILDKISKQSSVAFGIQIKARYCARTNELIKKKLMIIDTRGGRNCFSIKRSRPSKMISALETKTSI